jgi:cytochrome c553
MKNWMVALTIAAAFTAGPTLAGNGDPAAGAQKVAVCGACHGATGNSVNPEWPNLASQGADYIAAQLKAYQQGARVNPIMAPNAAGLSEQDMADIGAYFSRQTLTGLEADAALAQAGRKLYRNGDTARGLPSCIGCHGPEGKGNSPARYPALRSQHSAYTVAQLKAYAAGERKAAGNDMMNVVAQKLTETEMQALAAYLQGLR